jgi:quinolinate synthase
VSGPGPVVTMTPSATWDEGVRPASSAYEAAKPAPASPIGSTETSATGDQPEAMTSPAWREDSAPMESVATTTRTPRLCPFSGPPAPDLKIVSGIGHRMKAVIEPLNSPPTKAFNTVNGFARCGEKSEASPTMSTFGAVTSTPTSTPLTSGTPLSLFVLGRESDPRSERGVECPGDLPPASDPALVERAKRAKAALGDRLFVLGHHYQRDEVIQFADVTGDSFKLARDAAARPNAKFIVFCGVHFMAESADILTAPEQKVILPDLAAGCSMADMARLAQVEDAWDVLADAGVAHLTVPVTYMNSSADIKAFCGKHDGVVCTSSNAKSVLEWALGRGEKVLFLPDQHLGRNTAVLQMGMSLDDCVVYDPHQYNGGLTVDELQAATMILWKGHCSVHGRFTEQAVDDVRARIPNVNVLVHPECQHEVVLKADFIGSTEFIIKTIQQAKPGSKWAIGTELNLVKRLAHDHPDLEIVFLEQHVCYCATMNRIDLPHLVWALENLAQGHVVNQITVDPETERYAKAALQRMLDLPGETARD